MPDETQCTDLLALPGFDMQTFPFLVQRNSKAVNLVCLSAMSMHRLCLSDNQTGSFEKLAIDLDDRINEQIKLVFISKQSEICEAVIESTFVRQLKDVIATKSEQK